MQMRLTIAVSILLVCIALWQTTGEPESSAEDVPFAAPTPVPEAPLAPSPSPRVQREVFDPRNYVQNSEFFPGIMQGESSMLQNMPGQSGPYDAEGKLILPIDPRKMH